MGIEAKQPSENNMNKFTVQVALHSTKKYNGVFEFDNLEDAIRKVKGNIIANCTAENASEGMDVDDGAAYYWDRDDNGHCVIRKLQD
tara:strand:- start:466 stop:726 length:261 start_codon:yes stop_codon:yes gene_type:complete